MKYFLSILLLLGHSLTQANHFQTMSQQQSTLTTADHHCEKHCRGEPTRTRYKLSYQAPIGMYVANPRLNCIAGPCQAWNQVHSTNIVNGGHAAEAIFDVWSRPTTWVLTVDLVRYQTGPNHFSGPFQYQQPFIYRPYFW